MNSAECRLSLSHHELDFSDGTVVFNYQNYALREAFNGPKQGTVKVGRIRYDAPAKSSRSRTSPAPSGPPRWSACSRPKWPTRSKSIVSTARRNSKAPAWWTSPRRAAPRLNVSFSSDSAADYRVSRRKPHPRPSPAGKVAIRGDRVTVDGLQAQRLRRPRRRAFRLPRQRETRRRD